MSPSRALFAAALLTTSACDPLDWSREASESFGAVVVPEGSVRSWTIWVGANEDALEGQTSLRIDAQTSAASGQPILWATLGWEGSEPIETYADASSGEALALDAEEGSGSWSLMASCDPTVETLAPPSFWEDELCWVSVQLDLEAVDGDVSVDWTALALLEGHGTQGNLVPDPELVMVVEELP